MAAYDDEVDGQAALESRRGNFFSIDIPTFRRLCGHRDADLCAAYLIIASGTFGSSLRTNWSKLSVQNRTAMNWRKADLVMRRLEQLGYIKTVRGGVKPVYELLLLDYREPMTSAVALLVEKLGTTQPRDSAERDLAEEAVRQGHAVRRGIEYAPLPRRRPEYAWLPKSIVGGVEGERPPVERIRRTRDALSFRLLIDLYGIQDLADEEGVNRRWLRKSFTRTPSHGAGHFQVWQFDFQRVSLNMGGDIFDCHRREPTDEEQAQGRNEAVDAFDRLHILEQAGLLEWVYYLVEDEAHSAVPIHPVALEYAGALDTSAIETVLGRAATLAGVSMSIDEKRDYAWADYYQQMMPYRFMLPVERLLREVQVVGIARLRYRANTTNTARWWSSLSSEVPNYLRVYGDLIETRAPQLREYFDQALVDINEISTLDQGDLKVTSTV